MRIPFVGGEYQARSLAAAAQETINLYPEKIESPLEDDKGGYAMYGCPGRTALKNLATIDAAAVAIRGFWSGGGRLFVVASTKYMEINSSYNLVGSVYTIANDAGNTPVEIFSNRNQLFTVSAGLGYIDGGNGLGPTLITFGALAGVVSTVATVVTWVSGDQFDQGLVGQTMTINGSPYTVLTFVSATTVILSSSAGTQTGVTWSGTPVLTATTGAFLGGYFIAARPNSRQFNISALNDGSTWSYLDFAIKEENADNIQSVLVSDGYLYLFGANYGFEVWALTGAGVGGFPFEKQLGASQGISSPSAWNPISINSQVFMVGGSQGSISAYKLEGFTPRRISTHAEEQLWNLYGLGPNCISYTYEEEGHTFWVIRFSFFTFAYDLTTGMWHQRYRWSSPDFVEYRTNYHTFIPEWGTGKHITGGNINGFIYESSVNIYSDAGGDLAWRRALPYAWNNANRLYFGRTELEMETGTVASGAAPTVSLDYSDDRGKTFSTPQTASLGVHDATAVRVFWPSLGSSRGRVFRLFGAGQSKVALIALNSETGAGAN